MPESAETLGTIYDIQRFSVHDGPGIRTTVFFKGCPLKCQWCCNPESQAEEPQLLYFENQCQKCYRCLEVCPLKAISKAGSGALLLDRQLCDACGRCVEACSHEARGISGRKMAVEGVYEVIRKDIIYYLNSCGGVTMSGGEPTYQPDFLFALLAQCRKRGLHTCLDTCGFVPRDIWDEIITRVDWVLLDNKHMDPKMHKRLTGVENSLILENTVKVSKTRIPVIIRVPLIKGYNDTGENMTRLADFMRRLALKRIDLLPYHRLGMKKYNALGLEYPLPNIIPFLPKEIEKIRGILASKGLEVAIV